jgi:hypothetical protein
MPGFGDYQFEIYLRGLSGVKPKLPVDFASLEERAERAMPAGVWSYVAGGCGDEHTQDLNVAAFRKWGLVPRMMVDGTQRDLSIELFGLKLPSPLFMSPIGVLGICAGRPRRSRRRPRRGCDRRSVHAVDAEQRSDGGGGESARRRDWIFPALHAQ